LQDLPQRRAGPDNLPEFLPQLELEIVLLVGQLRVEAGEPFAGAGLLECDRNLRRRVADEADVTF
jgi:hypothetical protein